jgi:hypothetical protein
MRKALAASGLMLALLGGLAMEAAAQTSCSGWNERCLRRCKESGAAACNYCTSEMSNCRKSGCWRRPSAYGGGRFCSLAKS